MSRVTASVLRFLLLLVAILGFAAAVLPALPVDTWWVRFLDYPRLQFLLTTLALLPFAALAVFFRQGARGRLIGIAALVLLGTGLAIQAVVLAPFLLPAVLGWPKPTVPAGSCPAESRLRLLTVNVQMTSKQDIRLLDMVREVDPDVAWFQETNARWEQELAPLAVTMPFSVTQTLPNYFGVHLFSKLELRDAQVHNLTDSRNPSIFTSVALPTGEVVKLYAVHPRPPQPWQGTAERDAQLMAASLAMRGDVEPHVLLGDLNAVPWEGMVHRALRLGNLGDPRTGRGFLATWNAHDILWKWPLDHVLPGPGFTLMTLRVLPAFGSDHQPLLVELCRISGIAVATPPPLLRDEEARARAVVQHGQGKASSSGASVPAGSDIRDVD